jgi:hypothetical protein
MKELDGSAKELDGNVSKKLDRSVLRKFRHKRLQEIKTEVSK